MGQLTEDLFYHFSPAHFLVPLFSHRFPAAAIICSNNCWHLLILNSGAGSHIDGGAPSSPATSVSTALVARKTVTMSWAPATLLRDDDGN